MQYVSAGAANRLALELDFSIWGHRGLLGKTRAPGPVLSTLAPRKILFQLTENSGEEERERRGEVFPVLKSSLIELKNSRKINTSEADFFTKGWGWRKETSHVCPLKCQELRARSQ